MKVAVLIPIHKQDMMILSHHWFQSMSRAFCSICPSTLDKINIQIINNDLAAFMLVGDIFGMWNIRSTFDSHFLPTRRDSSFRAAHGSADRKDNPPLCGTSIDKPRQAGADLKGCPKQKPVVLTINQTNVGLNEINTRRTKETSSFAVWFFEKTSLLLIYFDSS